jgi:hypothetical protein
MAFFPVIFSLEAANRLQYNSVAAKWEFWRNRLLIVAQRLLPVAVHGAGGLAPAVDVAGLRNLASSIGTLCRTCSS